MAGRLDARRVIKSPPDDGCFESLADSHGNAPSASPARTLLEIFRDTVASSPDRLAIDTDDAQLTYAELSDAVRALAGRLRRFGIGPGDRVGVHVPGGTVDLYVAILGVLHAGAAYVPVDADDPPAQAGTIWEQAEAAAVVGADLSITRLRAPGGVRRTVDADDDAWVIFALGSSGASTGASSGASTGAWTGVAVTHRVAAAFVDAEAGLWNVTEHDRVLAAVSVGNPVSCEEMWLTWRSGAVLVPAPSPLARGGGALGTWLAARRVSVVPTVEGQLRAAAGVSAAAATVRPAGAGEAVLVGYVVGDADSAEVRAAMAEHLPRGIAARIVRLDALPTDEAGRLDRGALPWPPPGDAQAEAAPSRVRRLAARIRSRRPRPQSNTPE